VYRCKANYELCTVEYAWEPAGGAVIPEGSHIDLPGRGTTFVHDLAGGAGAPVVLLHGLGVTAGINWGQTVGQLSGTRRTIAMDLRGHGRGIDARFSLAACAEDTVALLDALDIDRAIIGGYSMGGPISQLVARDHPDRVIGLVQCATATSFVDPFSPNAGLAVGALSAIAADVPSFVREQLTRFVWRGGPRPAMAEILREVRPTDRGSVFAAAIECVRFNSSSWFGDLEMPVAAVVTTRDAVVPAYRQLRMVRSSDDHTAHLVNGDHLVCVRQPERFARQLGLACESVSARSAMRHASGRL